MSELTGDTPDPDQAVQRWLDIYGAHDADAAWLLCDRHSADRLAVTVVEPDLTRRDVTYGELSIASRRLARVLRERGVGRGDRVAVLLGKRLELITTCLALWRLGAVHVPLFTAFAQGAIATRLDGSGARIVVTEADQCTKLDGIAGIAVLRIEDLSPAAVDSEPLDTRVAVGGQGQIIEIYTSGTTGNPKGVPIPLRVLAAAESYLHFSLDVREDDLYWNAADPGWAYGLYFAVLGPLAAGRHFLLYTGGFSPEQTVRVISELGVTNFAGAPTMYRALRGLEAFLPLRLRRASSAGEPLNPDLVAFGKKSLGSEIRDHYGQTEIAMVLGNHWNLPGAGDPVPGSIGRALPGFTVDIVDGQIAIDTENSPLMVFAGYVDDPERSAERFTRDGRWYLTSDIGHRDEHGNFSFSSRSDDVILAAGYRIGPSDVENALLSHPAVQEAAAVGRPDPDGIRGEQVEAFVVVDPDSDADPDLAEVLIRHVRDHYSKHAAPRLVHFVSELPKTPSGKIRRHVLREAAPAGAR
ncbi:AMP-binding protein [Aeromicrobium sp. CTD01-1L150]|uniref:AMP-binding protein n=1 Tax=Aeromicrobium sp. CTD01-1L150 TaxID=3341830 RepID=UPI0035C00402